MPTITVNGLRLRFEASGKGEPVVLVHGSWSDHRAWDELVAELPDRLRVIRYSRRGHGGSQCPPGQGRIEEDVADLAAIVEALAGEAAHLVGNSLGAQIAGRLADDRPDLVRSLALHEAPAWSVAPDDPAVQAIQASVMPVLSLLAAGAWEDGARLFADQIFGAGAWDTALPDALKRVMIANAPTFLDEQRAPDAHALDTRGLARLGAPALLSTGEASAPAFRVVSDRLVALLPQAERATLAGAGHVPHRTHPRPYAALLMRFWTPSLVAAGAD